MRKFSQMVSVIALGFAVMTTASNAQRQSQAREAPVETQESYDRNGPPQEGDDFYCRERRLGQWFYCERPQRPEEEQRTSQADTRSATARLAEVRARVDELKAEAILNPTPQNVNAYIAYQREQLDRASMFADVWRREIWQNPDLDYTLQRPVNSLGRQAWSDNRRMDRERIMAGLSQRYGVFYFYSSQCGACEVFSPIIKGISDRFGLSVMAVSMDGGSSTTFPNFAVNTGQYQQMGLTGGQVPALVLFDTVTRRPMPIGYGIMAADEVMDRIFVLTNVQPGSDF